jgi:protein SCO1/2
MRLPFTVMAVLIGLSALAAGCQGGPALHGRQITPTPAAGFALTSQQGDSVQLSDFRGDLVVITFLYANCTTACPLISLHLKRAADQLTPQEAGRVHFLAVSLDPERDTPETAKGYVEGFPTPQGLLFLMGTRTELEPLWASYNIVARKVMDMPAQPTEGTATPQEGGDHTGHTGYIVEHSIVAYLIDQQGVTQAAYVPAEGFDPGNLVEDIRTLLAQQ